MVTLVFALLSLIIFTVFALIAGAYLLTPRRERYTVQEFARLSGRCGELITVNDRALYCESHGPAHGTPIVMLHGFAASTFTWRHQWPALADAGYRVILIDHLGFGGSARVAGPEYSTQSHANLALAAMTGLHIPRAIVVGHSYGGRVAMQMALYAPERIIAIAAFAPEAFATRRPKISSFVRIPLFGYALVFYSTGPSAVRPGLRYVSGSESWLTPEVVAGYALPVGVRGHVRGQIWNSLSPKDGAQPVPANLSRIACPALFIWGEKDPVFPAGDADTLVQRLPNAQAQVFDGIGHLPHEEAPDEANVALLTFLAGVTAPTFVPAADGSA